MRQKITAETNVEYEATKTPQFIADSQDHWNDEIRSTYLPNPPRIMKIIKSEINK